MLFVTRPLSNNERRHNKEMHFWPNPIQHRVKPSVLWWQHPVMGMLVTGRCSEMLILLSINDAQPNLMNLIHF